MQTKRHLEKEITGKKKKGLAYIEKCYLEICEPILHRTSAALHSKDFLFQLKERPNVQ